MGFGGSDDVGGSGGDGYSNGIARWVGGGNSRNRNNLSSWGACDYPLNMAMIMAAAVSAWLPKDFFFYLFGVGALRYGIDTCICFCPLLQYCIIFIIFVKCF